MHIEPGVVSGAKMILSYATAAGALACFVRPALDACRKQGLAAFALRSLLATLAVFVFFEGFPKYPVGVSEVHFILGSSLFLLLGAAPAAIGLAAGLALQGSYFAPTDLPQYFINITSLLVPLYAMSLLAKRIIAPHTPYVALSYRQALALSMTYQGGVVAWVAFWAIYGQGVGAGNLAAISSFGAAYLLVIAIEPLADLALLAGAKYLHGNRLATWLSPRVYQPG